MDPLPQSTFPALPKAIQSTSPFVNRAISNEKNIKNTFMSMMAQLPEPQVPPIPPLPRDQNGFEDIEEFFNVANNLMAGNPLPSICKDQRTPKSDGIVIQGVKFSYGQADDESECSQSTMEDSLPSSPSPTSYMVDKSPTRSDLNQKRPCWSGASSQRGILRESTILPQIGSAVPVESFSLPTDNLCYDENKERDSIRLLHDYESSASSNSPRTSLESIPGIDPCLSSATFSQSQRGMSTNVAIQATDGHHHGLNHMSFYSRQSNSTCSSHPSTNLAPFGYGAGFKGVGRSASGALICEANGRTFELLVEQGPHKLGGEVAIQCTKSDIDNEMKSLFGGNTSKDEENVHKSVLNGTLATKESAEFFSEVSHVHKNNEKQGHEMNSLKPILLQPEKTGNHDINLKQPSQTSIPDQLDNNPRSSNEINKRSRRVSIAPSVIAAEKARRASVQRRSLRRSNVWISDTKPSNIETRNVDGRSSHSSSSGQTRNNISLSSPLTRAKQSGVSQTSKMNKPTTEIAQLGVERRASQVLQQPTEVPSFPIHEDDDKIDAGPDPSSKQSKPESSRRSTRIVQLNVTNGVDICPTATPSVTRKTRSSVKHQPGKSISSMDEALTQDHALPTAEADKAASIGEATISQQPGSNAPNMVSVDEERNNCAGLTLAIDPGESFDHIAETSHTPAAEDANPDAAENNEDIVLSADPVVEFKSTSERVTVEKYGDSSQKSKMDHEPCQDESTKANNLPSRELYGRSESTPSPILDIAIDDDDADDNEYGFDHDGAEDVIESVAGKGMNPDKTGGETLDDSSDAEPPVSRHGKRKKTNNPATKSSTKRQRTTESKRPRKNAAKSYHRNTKRVKLSRAPQVENSEPQEEETCLRRSKRTRIPRLKFWKNEHAVYERRNSQEIPTIAEIVMESDDDEEDEEWFAGRR